VNAEPYEPGAAAEWDELVAAAPMGTLLHSRRYLGYHGDRFEDASLLLREDSGRLLGVLPAAIDPADRGTVASHPGVTYGGIVHEGRLGGPAMIEALGLVAQHYAERGFRRLRYAPVPSIYHERPSADDLYALFRAGAERVRCDLACAVDLRDGPHLSSRRRRGLAKARRAGVEIAEGGDLVDELWPVVIENLARRWGAEPTHSAAEMRLLADLFPDEISAVVARLDGRAVAGVVLFDSARVSHSQYIASVTAGQDVSALDAVFDHCLTRASERGARYFDFGTSNREAGRVLNDGLYAFKSEFGGGGAAYEFYELELSRATPKPVSP
jgi:hypothetical protein